MRIRGAIFDADGTLLDSMSIWDTIGERYLRSLGKEPRENLNEVFRSMSLQQAARHYQQVYGITLGEEQIIDGVGQMLVKEYRQHVGLKPGMRELLAWLEKAGVKMCVATATDRALAEAALARLGIRRFFTEVLTCGEVGHGKDEPEIYEAALQRLGTCRQQTLVFEDALHAVQTAKTAGFYVAAVREDAEPDPEAVRSLADVYLEGPEVTAALERFLSTDDR